jgi:hypothetical protein
MEVVKTKFEWYLNSDTLKGIFAIRARESRTYKRAAVTTEKRFDDDAFSPSWLPQLVAGGGAIAHNG